MFKWQISLNRHNAGLKFNYCLRFDPCHFSLPSTFNVCSFFIVMLLKMQDKKVELKTIHIYMNKILRKLSKIRRQIE
jgi:hypothetical protein